MRVKFIVLYMYLMFNAFNTFAITELNAQNNAAQGITQHQPQLQPRPQPIKVNQANNNQANKVNTSNMMHMANTPTTNAPNITVSPNNAPNNTSMITNNLDNVDNQTNDINVIKRKIELEKLKSDLRKSQNSVIGNVGSSSGGYGGTLGMPQTVATGIIINGCCKKIATLNFADGSDLDVEVGNRVNDYYVTDITVNGVILTKFKKSGKRPKSILIKRSYSKTPINNIRNNTTRANTQDNNPFVPTPTTTDANMDNTISSPFSSELNSSEVVPPIVARD